MRVKQEITSLIQNFAWETDPNWKEALNTFENKIKYFWSDILDRPAKK